MQDLPLLGMPFQLFSVTAYSLWVAAAVLVGWVLTLVRSRKQCSLDAALSLLLAVTLGAWLGARLVYCLTCWDYIMVDLEGWAFLLRPWEGGYTLWGGVWGGLLAAWLVARKNGRLGEDLDLLVPGSAAALMLLRLGEMHTAQGMGHYIQTEAFQFFPFAVPNVFSDPAYDFFEYQIPVFFWEAVAALALLIWALAGAKKRCPGEGAQGFLILLSVSQIFLESLREYEFIRFGFVRFNQLGAAAVLLAILLWRLRGAKKKGRLRSLIGYGVCVGIVVAIEFALDKSQIPNPLLYAVMALTLIAWAVLTFRAEPVLSEHQA